MYRGPGTVSTYAIIIIIPHPPALPPLFASSTYRLLRWGGGFVYKRFLTPSQLLDLYWSQGCTAPLVARLGFYHVYSNYKRNFVASRSWRLANKTKNYDLLVIFFVSLFTSPSPPTFLRSCFLSDRLGGGPGSVKDGAYPPWTAQRVASALQRYDVKYADTTAFLALGAGSARGGCGLRQYYFTSM